MGCQLSRLSTFGGINRSLAPYLWFILDAGCSSMSMLCATSSCEMDEVIKLLLTVSGGLEDLADEQVQSIFKDVLLNKIWHKRTSGSQLYLDLRRARHDGKDVALVIAESIKKLDYVEYIYVLLNTFNISSGEDKLCQEERASDVLSLIKENTSNIPKPSIDFCTHLCDLIDQQQSLNVDVGLGSLPGTLLSAPEVKPFDESEYGLNPNCGSFAVNTIYTRKDVAKATVDKVAAFVQQHDNSFSIHADLWLDAGSGDGSLLENMPQGRSIGVDTHPTSHQVQRMDFLQLTRQWLQNKQPHNELYVISNPPFSVSSRGDYSPIVSFINHSFDVLQAKFIAVICPSKFTRERIWKSLGLSEKAHLWARFLLPQDSFYEPATGKPVHIHSFCLIFGHSPPPMMESTDETIAKSGCHISAKRDKGSYREISTCDLKASVVSGLKQTGMDLAVEKHAKYMLNAKLLESSFELWWQVNHMQPCSSVNSNCAKIPNHSIGWISLSAKPAVALAMNSLAVKRNTNAVQQGCIAVNLMSGEGTIELEAARATNSPVFMISGDIRDDCAFKSSKRVTSLKACGVCNPLVDFVVWDAQNLPLRKGFADAVIGDLSIQGTAKKAHQQPTVGKTGSAAAGPSATLKYSSVLSESSRILQPKGRAAFISVDHRSLGGACKQFNWNPLNHGANMSLGGLNAKLFLFERNKACTKDMCLTIVPPESPDHSSWLLDLANKAVQGVDVGCLKRKTINPIRHVNLLNTFVHPAEKYSRHCYRFTFHDEIRNVDAKVFEKEVRRVVSDNLLEGMSM